MNKVSISLTMAALVVAGTAFAQTPMRSGPYQDREYRYPQQAQVPLAQPLPDGTTRDPNGTLQRDRFGNIVRGDRCADHWANCAYDPMKQ
jgi:hypothetical protein